MTPDELRDRILRWEDPHTDRRLFQGAHSLFYDGQPLPRLDLADLDLDEVARYLDDTNQADLDEDLVRLLRAWRMYDGSHPTVGGLVLFGRHPQAKLESSRIVVGALAGDDIGNDFVDRNDIDGPLLSVIAQIETFLRLYLSLDPPVKLWCEGCRVGVDALRAGMMGLV